MEGHGSVVHRSWGNGNRGRWFAGEIHAARQNHQFPPSAQTEDGAGLSGGTGTRVPAGLGDSTMKNVMKHKNYAGTVEYSAEDDCLFGRILGISDVISYEGESVAELRAAFEEAVDDYLNLCAETGRKPDKPYSGKILLRVSPELHAHAAMQAKLHGMSLNQWAAERLAEA